jgi:anti-sigma B factor antagonist
VVSLDRKELAPFRCEVMPDRASARVCPVGEVDLATVPVVDTELAELWAVGFTGIVLDLREVTFLDSTGVRLLLAWQTRSSADGFRFEVIPGPPAVQRALELSSVADQLSYCSPNGDGGGSRLRRSGGG